ncbi:hypothetical protein Micbo1qcDRAFT_59861 [Microdochium bolleyi]|uniref:Uncharacterized protein n=1 Tax=Microdochium bolleyi TaxID=196109 RepID=A0A136J4Q0_9PEZI|nr:hypothetical protein Micbo1qcDRAFT_59861 [Microdochium bolleyi]
MSVPVSVSTLRVAISYNILIRLVLPACIALSAIVQTTTQSDASFSEPYRSAIDRLETPQSRWLRASAPRHEASGPE